MTDRAEPLIVAIDGPSGVGKTTVARAVASRLGVPYLGTGAMYRAVALEVLDRGVDPTDRAAVEALAGTLALDFAIDEAGHLEVQIDGVAVGSRIRDPGVAQVTSQISAYPGVRRRMVDLQRRWARRHGAVLEGRDIGTRVFPDTPHKFFLDAPLETRVDRRWRELVLDARNATVEEVTRELRERDERDSTRSDSPLVCDDSYVRVETGGRTPEEVVSLIVERVRR